MTSNELSNNKMNTKLDILYNNALNLISNNPVSNSINNLLPIKMKLPTSLIAFDLVIVAPMSSPSSNLLYMDYVYDIMIKIGNFINSSLPKSSDSIKDIYIGDINNVFIRIVKDTLTLYKIADREIVFENIDDNNITNKFIENKYTFKFTGNDIGIIYHLLIHDNEGDTILASILLENLMTEIVYDEYSIDDINFIINILKNRHN